MGTSAACERVDFPGGTVRALGDVVDASSFVSIQGAPAASGPRLREITFSGADGSRFTGDTLYDSALGITCAFSEMTDGERRCLPTHLADVSFQGVFADASCTVPVLVLPACAHKPDALITNFASACGGIPPQLAEVGASLDAAWQLLEGECSPIAASSIAPLAFYGVGEAIPLERFAESQLVVGHEGRIASRTDQAEDGSSHALDLFDTELRAPCAPAVDTAGHLRCLPLTVEAAGMSLYFADAACTTPVFAQTPVSSPSPGAVPCADRPQRYVSASRTHALTCAGQQDQWFSLAPLATSPEIVFTLDAGGACVEYGSAPASLYAGTEVSAETFAPMNEDVTP